jgi:hypothetical protein
MEHTFCLYNECPHQRNPQQDKQLSSILGLQGLPFEAPCCFVHSGSGCSSTGKHICFYKDFNVTNKYPYDQFMEEMVKEGVDITSFTVQQVLKAFYYYLTSSVNKIEHAMKAFFPD